LTNPAIRLRDVCRSYGPTAVLKDVNLEVWPGQIHGMLGSNGSGKSTLLRIVAGALKATSGHADIEGTTGYVAQKFSLYEDLSVEENLAFSARCYGLHGKALKVQVNETLERFDFARIRKQRTGQLSEGWKQRLALAAAMCHAPSVLLLDEPTAGVDPAARSEFWEILADCAHREVAILLATHHMDEADRCDRISYMNEGTLISFESGKFCESDEVLC
jgi:ABC-2 type transport system ATP-binding protein